MITHSCEAATLSQCYFFFFQAEDGIRDYKVTGVQTCALPIYSSCNFSWTDCRQIQSIYLSISIHIKEAARILATYNCTITPRGGSVGTLCSSLEQRAIQKHPQCDESSVLQVSPSALLGLLYVYRRFQNKPKVNFQNDFSTSSYIYIYIYDFLPRAY